MPSAKGLFHRAIAQSLPGTYFTEGLAAAISAEIAAQLGTEATSGELAERSPGELVDATTALLNEMPSYTDAWGAMALTPTPFSPVVDGTTLPRTPWRALADGVARGVELIVGHTRDEYSLFNTWRGEHVTNEQVSAGLDLLIPTSGPGVDEQYRAAYPEADPGQLKEIINADWLFRMPSHHLAAAQHAGGGTAWLYELCWSFNPDEGASHSLDVLLVFGTLSGADIRSHPSAYSSAATEVDGISRTMRADWVNFASSGNPGWAPYAPGAGSTRVYDAEAVVRPYPEERSRQIWSRHRFDALDLAPPRANRSPRS